MALVRLQLRHDTAANWAAANPVLQAGEPGHEVDTGRLKIGNGTTAWNQLAYSSMALSSSPPPAAGTASAGVGTTAARSDHSHALPSSLSLASLSVSGATTVGGSLEVAGALTGGAHTHASSEITDLSEAVDDRVASLIKAGQNISVSYNDTLGTLTINAASQTAPVSSVAGRTGAVTLAAADISGLDESVQDSVGAMVKAGSNIAVSYDDAAGTLTIASTAVAGVSSVNGKTGAVTLTASDVGGAASVHSHTVAALTDFPAQSSNSGKVLATTGSSLQWVSVTPEGIGAVTSVNGKTGSVVLAAADVGAASSVHTHSVASLTDFPALANNAGKVLTTSGTALSWTAFSAGALSDFPPQAGNAGKVLSTTGTSLVWVADQVGGGTQSVTSVNGKAGAVSLSAVDVGAAPATHSHTVSALTDFPSVVGNEGRALVVRGNSLEWGDVASGGGGGGGGSGWDGEPKPTPIVIAQQPASVTASGGAASFTVSATGGSGPISIQWQRRLAADGEAWQNIASANQATLSLTGASQSLHLSAYRALLTDGANTATSAQATLFVSTLAIVSEPQDATVSPGGTATFTVNASVTGFSVIWQRSVNNGSTWSNLTSTSPTLNVSVTPSLTNTLYRAIVSAGGASATSRSALLTVAALPLTITDEPDDVQWSSPPVTLSVVVSGSTGVYTYQWQQRRATTATWTNISSGLGGNTPTVTLTEPFLGQMFVRCQVNALSDGVVAATVTSREALLQPQSIQIGQVIPAAQSVTHGSSASMYFKLADHPVGVTLSYQWFRSTSADGPFNLAHGGSVQNAPAGTYIYTTGSSGQAATSVLSLSSVTEDAYYRCTITTSAGDVFYTSVASVDMSYAGVTFTSQPQDATIFGDTASFSFSYTGGNPSRSANVVTWYRMSQKAMATSIVPTAAGALSLALSGLSALDDGDEIWAVVDTGTGAFETRRAKLSVPGVRIVSQPASAAGETVTFTVELSGPAAVQWFRRGALDDTAGWIAIPGEVGNSLTLIAATANTNWRWFRASVLGDGQQSIQYTEPARWVNRFDSTPPILITDNVGSNPAVGTDLLVSTLSSFARAPSLPVYSASCDNFPAQGMVLQRSRDNGVTWSDLPTRLPTNATLARNSRLYKTLPEDQDGGTLLRARLVYPATCTARAGTQNTAELSLSGKLLPRKVLTMHPLPHSYRNPEYRALRWFGGPKLWFMAIRNGPSSNPVEAFVSSSDGAGWQASLLPTGRLESFAFSDTVGVAVGRRNGPTDPGVAAITTDGVNWRPLQLPKALKSAVVEHGNGVFVIHAGDSIMTSTNGTQWTVRVASMPNVNLSNLVTDGAGTWVTDTRVSYNNGVSWSVFSGPVGTYVWDGIGFVRLFSFSMAAGVAGQTLAEGLEVGSFPKLYRTGIPDSVSRQRLGVGGGGIWAGLPDAFNGVARLVVNGREVTQRRQADVLARAQPGSWRFEAVAPDPTVSDPEFVNRFAQYTKALNVNDRCASGTSPSKVMIAGGTNAEGWGYLAVWDL